MRNQEKFDDVMELIKHANSSLWRAANLLGEVAEDRGESTEGETEDTVEQMMRQVERIGRMVGDMEDSIRASIKRLTQ